MAEALAGLSIAANIIQLFDFGSKVLKRLEEYQSQLGDIPEAFRHVKVELRVLVDALNRTKEACDAGFVPYESTRAILPAIEECTDQIKLLEDIIARALPFANDSWLRRAWKALRSLQYDAKLKKTTEVVHGYIQVLTFHAASSQSAVADRTLPQPAPSSTVPFRRDPHFVDRDILAEIDSKSQQSASRVAIVGLGGVGKSQLAIEYAYRVRDRSPDTWVFWVHAGSAARFEEGYRTIAERVRLPGCSKPDTDILRLVHNWLSDENNGRWVMIVDNADDINVFTCPSDRHRGQKNDVSGGAVTTLLKFLPQSPNGSFLITSRSRDAAFQLTGNYSDIITVHPMAQQAALALLRNKLGRSCEQEDDAGLVEALDYMPLAIAQAAAYISRRSPRATVSTYLHDIHKGDRDRAELLEVDLGDARRDGASSNSVLATWQISFEYIRAVRPTATELLSLMSLFDRQGIPESMLAFCYGDGKDASSTFEEDLSMLIGFSLVAADIDGHKFEMHRLVQFSTRKWLELQGELETWKDGYAAIMNHFYPDGSYETWKVCQELFPHALAARTCRPTDSNALENWASVLYKAALYADEMANYETALELGRLALEAEEQVLGPEHHDTLLSSKLVSGILLHQGSLGGLSAVDLQSAECRELGPKNADSPTDVCLGLAPESQLKYEEAEAMIRRRLEVCERTLGPEHPETLVSVGRLALARARLGRVEEAEVMPQRALKLLEQVLGPDHPTSVSTLNTVGVILEAQGKYEEAETIFRQVLGSYERVMGSEHPTTLVTVNNLGAVLEKQERYEETEPLYRRALQGYEKILGPKHPDTLMTLHRLRLVLGEGLGKHQEAEALHSRVTKT